ncbi:unnamed protein product [Dicrocoelium dendriticum]|nr:unnamed protein product [Dicrocoelium dendriticum]
MDLLFQSLRIKLYQSDHDLLLFDEEISRLENILRSLVFAGESNSLLILGRRGSGKKRLVSHALENVRKDLTVKQNLLEVHLNGLVHTSDLSALRSMAKQLHRELLLDNFDPEASTHKTEEIKMHSFSQQLRLFLNEVSNGKDTSKCLLIVLHEFDLFAMHRNQILLYNLFDCCQSSANPICVIGLTCRLRGIGYEYPVMIRANYASWLKACNKHPSCRRRAKMSRIQPDTGEVLENRTQGPLRSALSISILL